MGRRARALGLTLASWLGTASAHGQAAPDSPSFEADRPAVPAQGVQLDDHASSTPAPPSARPLTVPARSPLRAAPSFAIRPQLGTAFGTTDFELEFAGRDSDGRQLEGRSVLEWPVNFVLVGFELELAVPMGLTDQLVAGGSLLTNAGNARGTMDDSDYVGSREQDIPETRFAFTKSDTTSAAVYGELWLGYTLRRWAGIASLTPFAGYRHEHYNLRALGARGTYPDEMGDPMAVRIPRYLVGAHYTADHVLPFAGLAVEPRPLGPLHWPMRARVFYLYDRSEDDHPLRGKRAVGHTTGAGLSGGLFPSVEVREHVRVGAGAEVFYLKGLRGVLRQSFYADDEQTPEDEREQSIPESDFYVKSLRTQLTLFVELAI